MVYLIQLMVGFFLLEGFAFLDSKGHFDAKLRKKLIYTETVCKKIVKDLFKSSKYLDVVGTKSRLLPLEKFRLHF